jgi:hypothetical protein
MQDNGAVHVAELQMGHESGVDGASPTSSPTSDDSNYLPSEEDTAEASIMSQENDVDGMVDRVTISKGISLPGNLADNMEGEYPFAIRESANNDDNKEEESCWDGEESEDEEEQEGIDSPYFRLEEHKRIFYSLYLPYYE